MKKILIAEDEPQLLKLLLDRFTKEGFVAVGAPDGAVALEMAFKEHPDLILLDILMPVMDGVTALRRLRQDAWGKTAFVMVLTNLRDSARVAECLSLGVPDYLVKSDCRLEEIVKRVKEKLGN